jgi:hypothetical protein
MSMSRVAALALVLVPAALAAAEVTVPPAARTALELTLYEGDLALVKDQRTLHLSAAQATLAFAGVSPQMQPDSVLLRVLGGDKLQLVEQAFDFDVLSPQALLQRSLGREVGVHTFNPATGKDVVERAKVLAVDQGLVLDIGGKIHTQVPGRIVFDGLPAGLRAAPTLLMTVKGPAAKDLRAELSYLTGGLSWRTTYVADFDADAGRLDLTAWAAVTNAAGVDFADARVKLVSGSLNRVAPAPAFKAARAQAEAMMAAAPAAGVAPHSLGGYHVYDLGQPLTLANNRSRQIALLSGTGLTAKQEHVVRGEDYFYRQQMPERPPVVQAETAITLKNDTAAGLGLPLPAGSVRIYGQDEAGAPQFLGESMIAHTPEGGEVRLVVGRDVDLTAEREQKSFVRAAERIFLVTWRIVVRNAKAKAAAVKVVEPLFGAWEITRETQPRDRANAQMAQWTLNVPAKGQAVLEYTARIEN